MAYKRDIEMIKDDKIPLDLEKKEYGPLSSLDGFPSNEFITIDPETYTIAFKIQSDPIKEVGLNGCQLDDMIHAARYMLNTFNARYHSDYNDIAIMALDQALTALSARLQDRIKRGVEGFNKK